jgi:DNA-binding transcriptional MerR regulator
MAVEVEFITLGDASEKLGVPAPTLRHWTDQLEEYGIHFVKRNNRNERIYYDNDLEIFAFLRNLKAEHGRRTTTKDLAYVIYEMRDRFKLRSKEEAPVPQPSNKTADLLNQDDIKRLMESERVKKFIGIVISETTKNLKNELIEEVRETVREQISEQVKAELEANNRKMEEVAERIEENLKKRDEQMVAWITEIRERNNKKGFFQRLFGK